MARPVTHELNYIEHHSDFIPKLHGPPTTDAAYNDLVAGVTTMMNGSPKRAKLQYRQTLAALSRMREAYKGATKPRIVDPR